MGLFNKIDRMIDYNNSYTLRRAISILDGEFLLAEKNKNKKYATEVLNITKQVYDKFSSMYRESAGYGETMSYMQKLWAGRLRQFIASMIKRLGDNFDTKESKNIYTEQTDQR